MRYAHIETEESRKHMLDMALRSHHYRKASKESRDEISKTILERPLKRVINLIEAAEEFVKSQPGIFIEIDDAEVVQIGDWYDQKTRFSRDKTEV